MARDVNKSYKRMAFEKSPIKSEFLFDDLTKTMKEAYITGKVTEKTTKNYQSRSFQKGKRPASFNPKFHQNKVPRQGYRK